jgi:hypothetical protein
MGECHKSQRLSGYMSVATSRSLGRSHHEDHEIRLEIHNFTTIWIVFVTRPSILSEG